MAGVEIGFTERMIAIGRNADSTHEVHRLGDALSESCITLCLRALANKAEHPLMHILQVSVATLRECTQQVQRRSRLAVSHVLTLRIRDTRSFIEIDAVDDVATV
ncbi:hypothetical protein D3C80_1319600 [compost metagenome]